MFLTVGRYMCNFCIHSGIVELEGLLLMVPALTSVKNGEHIVSCVLFKRNYVNCTVEAQAESILI